MKTIVIIHNLNSRGKNINEDYVRELLNKKGINFHYFQTKQISDVDEIIKKYNNPSEFQYCSIGGDGSLNALVNSLMKNNITMPEVSCLPGGSGSDFIRTFALPQNIEEAVEHLIFDNFYEVDVGLIKNKTDVKYFINVLNIGFLASTVEVSVFNLTDDSFKCKPFLARKNICIALSLVTANTCIFNNPSCKLDFGDIFHPPPKYCALQTQILNAIPLNSYLSKNVLYDLKFSNI